MLYTQQMPDSCSKRNAKLFISRQRKQKNKDRFIVRLLRELLLRSENLPRVDHKILTGTACRLVFFH